MTEVSNNKRIAKNTLMLYIRMLLTMLVTLYTSRIILNALGIEDFGIYNVVGGVVTMFAFLNGTMAAATQRFLSYEIGRNDIGQLFKVFNQSLIIHCFIAIVIFLLCESIGYWFINEKLTIPETRMNATLWVFHFAILSLMVSIIQVPFNAMIIAKEKMSVYAYFSIVEVVFKLLIAYSLTLFTVDKLKLYSVLIFCTAVTMTTLYGLYCKYKFNCPFQWVWDKQLNKVLMSFAGWNLSAHIALLGRTQGLNILLNIFFGPAVNAARGIAVQINTAASSFVTNFKLAANPQIVKLYAQSDFGSLRKLIIESSKFSCLLLLLILIPLYLEIEQILYLWLKTVPEHTVVFARLTLLGLLADTFSGNLGQGALATGSIKRYQLTLSTLFFMVPLLSYALLKKGFSEETVFAVDALANIVALGCRLFFLKRMIQLPVFLYLKQVVFSCLLIGGLSVIPSCLIYYNLSATFVRIFCVILSSSVSMLVFSFFLGLNKAQKEKVKFKIKRIWETI